MLSGKMYLASACVAVCILASAVASAPAAAPKAHSGRGATVTDTRSHAPQTVVRAAGSGMRGRGARSASAALIGGNSKRDCIYSADSIATLATFEALVGHSYRCALVYNNASVDWAEWEDPWFLTDRAPRYRWGEWASAAGLNRQLIITNNLFPSEVNGADWLQQGAQGAFQAHARGLARNLVAAGLGDSVIRLADEANGTSEPDAVGNTIGGMRLWVEFWRRTVLAMRSVPGANFKFDWCINAYWRPLPLEDWYPGNDVVDIIGIDAYDAGVPNGQNRWNRIYNQPDGIKAVQQFAAAHGKPLSLPEWGLTPSGTATLGGGSDPSYIDDIAAVVRNSQVAYQSYFYNHDSAAILAENRASLINYIQDFEGD